MSIRHTSNTEAQRLEAVKLMTHAQEQVDALAELMVAKNYRIKGPPPSLLT